MAMRLASTAQEILSQVGVEILPSLTDTDKSAVITLLDPSSYEQAKRTLRTAGMKTRRISPANVEISALLEDHEEEDEDTQMQKLISSWRSFAKRSSDNGFRKAARIIGTVANRTAKSGHNSVEAARQIAKATMQLAQKSKSKGLKKLATVLGKAAERGDEERIGQILAGLSGRNDDDLRPVLRDPQDNPKLWNNPLRKKKTSARRVAQADPGLVQEAYQYLKQKRTRESKDLKYFQSLQQVDDGAFDEWEDNYDSDSGHNPEELQLAWNQALANIVQEMLSDQDRSRRVNATYTGPEDGIDRIYVPSRVAATNCGFAVNSDMDIRVAAKGALGLVEKIIEEYAWKTHPDDLTRKHVVHYLKKKGLKANPTKVLNLLRRVTRGGIPQREQESEESKEDSKVNASRKASGGIGVGAYALDKKHEEKPVKVLKKLKRSRKIRQYLNLEKDFKGNLFLVQELRDTHGVYTPTGHVYMAPSTDLEPVVRRRGTNAPEMHNEIESELESGHDEVGQPFKKSHTNVVLWTMLAHEVAEAVADAKADLEKELGREPSLDEIAEVEPRARWFTKDLSFQEEADRNNELYRRELEFLRTHRQVHEQYHKHQHGQKVVLPWLQNVYALHGGVPQDKDPSETKIRGLKFPAQLGPSVTGVPIAHLREAVKDIFPGEWFDEYLKALHKDQSAHLVERPKNLKFGPPKDQSGRRRYKIPEPYWKSFKEGQIKGIADLAIALRKDLGMNITTEEVQDEVYRRRDSDKPPEKRRTEFEDRQKEKNAHHFWNQYEDENHERPLARDQHGRPLPEEAENNKFLGIVGDYDQHPKLSAPQKPPKTVVKGEEVAVPASLFPEDLYPHVERFTVSRKKGDEDYVVAEVVHAPRYIHKKHIDEHVREHRTPTAQEMGWQPGWQEDPEHIPQPGGGYETSTDTLFTVRPKGDIPSHFPEDLAKELQRGIKLPLAQIRKLNRGVTHKKKPEGSEPSKYLGVIIHTGARSKRKEEGTGASTHGPAFGHGPNPPRSKALKDRATRYDTAIDIEKRKKGKGLLRQQEISRAQEQRKRQKERMFKAGDTAFYGPFRVKVLEQILSHDGTPYGFWVDFGKAAAELQETIPGLQEIQERIQAENQTLTQKMKDEAEIEDDEEEGDEEAGTVVSRLPLSLEALSPKRTDRIPPEMPVLHDVFHESLGQEQEEGEEKPKTQKRKGPLLGPMVKNPNPGQWVYVVDVDNNDELIPGNDGRPIRGQILGEGKEEGDYTVRSNGGQMDFPYQMLREDAAFPRATKVTEPKQQEDPKTEAKNIKPSSPPTSPTKAPVQQKPAQPPVSKPAQPPVSKPATPPSQSQTPSPAPQSGKMPEKGTVNGRAVKVLKLAPNGKEYKVQFQDDNSMKWVKVEDLKS